MTLTAALPPAWTSRIGRLRPWEIQVARAEVEHLSGPELVEVVRVLMQRVELAKPDIITPEAIEDLILMAADTSSVMRDVQGASSQLSAVSSTSTRWKLFREALRGKSFDELCGLLVDREPSSKRTITALYETTAAAEEAKTRLADTGVSSGSIVIHTEDSAPGSTKEQGGMLSGLKTLFGWHDDSHAYAEGVSRGHYLLTAKVDDDITDAAIRVLESTGAVDLDEKQAEWKTAGWNMPAPSTIADTGADDTIEIVEERLVVGKREVERGGVRVRSYVVETPVSEQVTLREENVNIERRAVTRPIAAGEDAFLDRTIEMREIGEEAVIGKQAVVTEDLTIRKNVGQRTEEIKDTVRHTEVDVQQVGATSKTGAPSRRPNK